MSQQPFDRPPYLDWSIDRWKVGLVVVLTLLLAVTGLAQPWSQPPTPTEQPLQPLEPLPQVAVSEAVAAPTLPLTLAHIPPNAVLPARGLSTLAGTAAPASQVEIRLTRLPIPGDGPELEARGPAQELATITADGAGFWQLPLETPLPAGVYLIELRELTATGEERGSLSVVVTVLATGSEGPIALATPVIQAPAIGARLPGDGPLRFTGSGLPGMRIRLYINGRQMGEALVDHQQMWQIELAAPLPAAGYVARAAALGPQGQLLAESAPVALVVEPPASGIPAAFGPAPAVPLQLSRWGFSDSERRLLLLEGMATPLATVTAWLDQMPLAVVNAGVDGRWRLWLIPPDSGPGQVAVSTDLGERVEVFTLAEVRQTEAATALTLPPPVILWPRPGQDLATRRPLVQGLAVPTGQVNLQVNGITVARIRADAWGQWAYRPAEALPQGPVTLQAELQREGLPHPRSEPVRVTIPPRL